MVLARRPVPLVEEHSSVVRLTEDPNVSFNFRATPPPGCNMNSLDESPTPGAEDLGTCLTTRGTSQHLEGRAIRHRATTRPAGAGPQGVNGQPDIGAEIAIFLGPVGTSSLRR